MSKRNRMYQLTSLMVCSLIVYTWQIGDAGLGLAQHGLVQCVPIWCSAAQRSPVGCFVHEFKTTSYI